MNHLTVYPVTGRSVAQPIDESGSTVPANSYWRRRLATGDVTLRKPAVKAVGKAVGKADAKVTAKLAGTKSAGTKSAKGKII